MKSKGLLERSKQPFWRSYRVRGAGAVILCIGVCFLLISCDAAGRKLEEQNKAVARAAFFDYLNHRDFKRFEEIHTKDFVKHYNNSSAENLTEEMGDAKGQYASSSDLTFTENWISGITVWRFVHGMIAEEWVFSNDLDLYRQLGLFKEPGS